MAISSGIPVFLRVLVNLSVKVIKSGKIVRVLSRRITLSLGGNQKTKSEQSALSLGIYFMSYFTEGTLSS